MARRTQKRIALLVGVPVLLGGSLLGAYVVKTVHKKNKMQTSLREGTSAYKAGDYQVTMDKLGYYVSQNRKDGEAVLMIADARYKTKLENSRHVLEAIPYAKVAAEDLPGDVRPLEMLLMLYGEARFSLERLQVADELLKINPKHADALAVKSEVLVHTGKSQDAVEVALKRCELYPDDVEAHRDAIRVMVIDKVDDKNRVVKFMQDAVARHPTDPRFTILLTQAYALAGDAQGAVKAARDAAEMPITSAIALKEVLDVLDVVGNIDRQLVTMSEKLLEREMKGPLARDVATVAAERAWKAGRIAVASEAVAKAFDPKDLPSASDDALGWSAYFAVISGAKPDSVDVKPLMAQLASRTTKDASFWSSIVEAQGLLNENKPQEARAKVTAAKGFRPESDLAEYVEGDIDQRVGEWRSGVARWTRLSKAQPTWRVVKVSLITVLLQRGEVSQAATEAESAASARPQPTELLMLARAYAMLVENDQAKAEKVEKIGKFADDLAGEAKGDAELLALVARIYLGIGRDQEGENIVRTLLEKTPAPETAVLSDLASSLRKKNPQLSEQLLARARVDADSPDLALQAALQFAEGGHADQGRALLERGREKHKGTPEELSYAIRLAVFLDRTRDPGALDLFESLAAANENEPYVQVSLLDSECAWKSEKSVTAAIERLRRITGDQGTMWKLQDARRLLIFSPSQARAAQVVQLLSEVVARDPRNANALALASEAQMLLGDRNAAIDLLTKAVTYEPERATFYPRVIELLQQAGRTDEAGQQLIAFSKITRLSPDMQRRRAKLLSQQGLWDLAAADFKALADRGSAEDRYSYGAVLLRKGDLPGARRAIDEVAISKDLSEAVSVAVADFYAAGGDFQKGKEILEQKLPSTSNAHRSLIMAAFFDRHKHPELAEQQYIEQAKDKKAESLAELASFYYKQQRVADAKKVVADGLAAHPGDAQLTKIDAFLKLGDGGGPEAMSLMVQALSDGNTNPAVQQLAEALLEYEKDPKNAEQYVSRLQAITTKYPNFFVGWRMLVQARFKRGQVSEAIDAARLAVKAMPIDPRPAQLATEALGEAGMMPEALVMAGTWRERSIEDTFAPDMAAGSILGALKRYPEALQRMDRWKARIMSEAKANPGYVEQYAQALAAGGRIADAKELLWPRLETDEAWALSCLRVADNLPPADQQAWIARIEPILLRRPQDRVALGRVLYAAGTKNVDPAMLDRAIAVLQPALDDTQTRAAAALFLAGAYEARQNTPEAIRHYRIAVDKVPNDPIALNNLAYLLSGDQKTTAEAVTFAKRAVDFAESTVQSPQLRKSFKETLGVCYFRNKQCTEAEHTFRESLALDATGLESMVGLAESLQCLERAEEAKTIMLRIDARPKQDIGKDLQPRIDALRAKLASK